MHECWSKTSTIKGLWADFGSFSLRSKYFTSRLVTMDENWLYHYDPRQSNNQCSGGIAAHPDQNFPRAKFVWNITRLNFFLDQDSILFIIYFTKGETINAECYWHLLVNLKNNFMKKRMGNFTKGLWAYTSRLAGHLQSKKNWPTWEPVSWSPTLFSGTGPFRTITCSLDWRNNWKLAIFLPTHSSLAPRGLGWTEKFLIFWVSCKS